MLLQHNRFVQECKDAEPDVLFVGDSMVQLMQQYEVIVFSLTSQTIKKRTVCLQFHLLIRRHLYPNTNLKYRSNKSKIDKLLTYQSSKNTRVVQC